ncbi:hypothetical protein [Alterileibacterium massiliense]|nr:hypothetical protein [Alterileibacterium massiliense]
MSIIKIIFAIMLSLPILIFGRFLIGLFAKEIGAGSSKNKRRSDR